MVVPCATTWSASPSSNDRIRHAAPAGSAHRNDPGRHAHTDRLLQQSLPLEVEPARRRLQRGASGGLGPGVEPQLERPVLVGRRVGPEEDAQGRERVAGLAPSVAPSSRGPVRRPARTRRPGRRPSNRSNGGSTRSTSPSRRRRRAPWSTPGPSGWRPGAPRRRSPRVAGRAASVVWCHAPRLVPRRGARQGAPDGPRHQPRHGSRHSSCPAA